MSKSTVQLECLASELSHVSSALQLLAESLEKDSSSRFDAMKENAALALWNRVPMYLETIYLIRRALEMTQTEMDVAINGLSTED